MQDTVLDAPSELGTRSSESGAAKVADCPEVLERFHSELALVETIASSVWRSIGRSVELDDLKAVGREGLLDAARRFDPTRGSAFSAFASYRVQGAVRDGVRQLSPLPRRAYERIAALEAAAQVSEGECEQTFAVAIADPRAARRALEEHLSSLATAAAMGIAAETRGDSADDGSPEEALARAEMLNIVRGAVTDLEDADQALIVRRHYLEGESLEDIARDLNISKSWASRLHTRAIARLAKRLRGVAG